jgi:CRP-like cAMP-binding protein
MKTNDCKTCQLRNLDCFTPVSSKTLNFINQFKTREISLNSHEVLTLEGETSNELFTIKSGWAFRYSTLSDGRRQILNILLPGDFTGLQAELDKPMQYGVEALTDCTVCVFPKQNLMSLYKNFPYLAHDLTWLAAHNELIVDENLVSVGQRNATERIALLFISLYKRTAQLGLVESKGFDFPLTQQHIADAMGLSLVHTNKSLAKLKKMDLFEFDGQRLIIKQYEKLKKLADYYSLPLRQRPLV